MSNGHTGYWLLTGAVIGYSVIAIWSAGLECIILGVILVIIGAIWRRGSGGWAAVVGFGGLPALILLWDVTSSPWACQPAIGDSTQPNVSYYTCVDTFVGRLTSYHVLAFWFGIIALLGFAWPLARYLMRRNHRPEG